MNNGPFEPDPYKPNSSLSVSCTSGLFGYRLPVACTVRIKEEEKTAATESIILI